MTDFPQAVEQWRPLLAKYFAPATVDKFLYVINGESGGNPEAVGDGGSAYGLFQSHYLQSGATPEQQVQDAYRLYVSDLGNGGTGFGDWGEGRTRTDPGHEGEPFGALGGQAGYANRDLMSGAIPDQSSDLTGQSIYRLYGNQNYSARRPPMPDNQSPADTTPTSPIATILAGAQKFPSGFASGGPSVTSGSKAKIYKWPVLNFTGSYAERMKAYQDAQDQAQADLDKWATDNGYTIRINKDGTASRWLGYQYDSEPDSKTPVYAYTDKLNTPGIQYDAKGQPVEGWVTDPYATQISRAITSYDSGAKSLDAKAKIDLSAGQAWAKAETDRATATSKSLSDYINTAKDIVALENVPEERAMSLANALKAQTEANAAMKGNFGSRAVGPPPQQYTDLNPIIAGLKNSLPAQPPAMYQPNNTAFAQESGQGNQQPVTPLPGAGSNGQKVPMDTPDAYLNPSSPTFQPGAMPTGV